ncbi:hypothetical protein PtrSN002B_010556 [Pyrenophora tritici-repentis]|nr:hypothetical protein A1F99_106340 [Pyrenophora tritici-repentis]KAG9379979.1 hypothetical protein A1F94_008874 [Pyrenophora tritici-repentis]KAI1524552.1 hypothetical protein PtrSN001A_010809 [Pyrenophora tritici-repentis]KAI1525895.1 hypothetical protein PtrSN001C_010444 [Pyrenophora tritici-repentis]KAI1532468.1 hypothetical protein PtrSN002B_010556 [Pyrenophora tritici-repentis]
MTTFTNITTIRACGLGVTPESRLAMTMAASSTFTLNRPLAPHVQLALAGDDNRSRLPSYLSIPSIPNLTPSLGALEACPLHATANAGENGQMVFPFMARLSPAPSQVHTASSRQG